MPKHEPVLLDYGRRQTKWLALALPTAAVGAAVGGAAAWLSLAILASDGPIIPLVLLLSPVSWIVEATDPSGELFRLVVAVGGPLVYALYAVVLTLSPRKSG